jgi:hypothetical protein
MSIKSTYGIKREVAIQCIISGLFKATNEELAEMLEALPESHFRNYCVDGRGYSDGDESQINSVQEFFSGK